MRPFLIAVALIIGVVSLAWADFQDGLDAYERGDYATAFREFKALAERGDAEAQQMLGFMHQFGHGVSQDPVEAAKWYQSAAEQGDPIAQSSLGILYANGLGVPQDYTEALKWHRRAAEQGHAIGQLHLGGAYANGLGVAQDYVQAYMWYSLGATGLPSGDMRDFATTMRDLVATALTPDQISEAQRLALEWKPKPE